LLRGHRHEWYDALQGSLDLNEPEEDQGAEESRQVLEDEVTVIAKVLVVPQPGAAVPVRIHGAQDQAHEHEQAEDEEEQQPAWAQNCRQEV
jgi:hypothetical protein